MVFWILLDVSLVLLFLLTSLLASEKGKHNVALIIMIGLTFISAFRYGVATDYIAYEMLYYTVSSDTTIKEPSFAILVEFLRNLGFSAQMMFFIYSSLNGFFMWKAIRFFFTKSQQILFAVVLYGVMVNLWFESMNGIRQWLAMAIFLWAIQFVINREVKKFYCIWIAILFTHFGAIVTCITIWIFNLQISKLYHIFIIISSILITQFIDVPSMIIRMLMFTSDVFGIGSQYIGYATNIWIQDSFARPGGTGLGALFVIVIYFIILFFLNIKNRTENFICNMLTVSILIRSLLWFSTPLLRLRGFFEIFLLIGLILVVERFNKESRLIISVILVIAYSALGLGFINQIASVQMINIEYQMNFNLLN